MAEGARKSSMRTIKSIAECLCDEIIACAAEDPASHCIKKKMEVEKNAKANRWLLFAILYTENRKLIIFNISVLRIGYGEDY